MRSGYHQLLSRALPASPDKYYAEKFVLPENRTAANKYYAAQVNATIAKYNRLKQQNHEAGKRMIEETLKDVAATHTVRSPLGPARIHAFNDCAIARHQDL